MDMTVTRTGPARPADVWQHYERLDLWTVWAPHLTNVRADSATGRGSAIIASGDGQQQVYAVGDTVGDGVTLAAIAADHVVFDRGGTR